MGDQFNLPGDFRGAILNIRSTLRNVQQYVNEIHTENVGAREELAQLIFISHQNNSLFDVY